ncbi:hypothetical protein QFC21_001487 [Naganishia friedmannii]|uniref:Uncharacterized protein n=1 Tax=Naganishia friedmannii TaxID=89922 RepID=A0ACC2W4K3_9TREE|nr:hypothetical protein QFC21_001487 [Naganishia friedmannii]
MGRLRRSRVHKAQRDVHRAARTRVRTRDLDLIQHNDLQPEEREKLENQPIDEEKPGLGQHYCVECAKYYETDVALKTHLKSKVHRRRLKNLREPAYTIEESERAVGLGRDNGKDSMNAAINPKAGGEKSGAVSQGVAKMATEAA